MRALLALCALDFTGPRMGRPLRAVPTGNGRFPMIDAAPSPRVGFFRRFELWLPGLIVLLDQVTKAMVRRTLPLHESVSVIPGVVDFTHIRNTGAAFGFLNGVDFPFKTVVIAVVATAAVIGVAWYRSEERRVGKECRCGRSSYGEQKTKRRDTSED